jgi:hypothetical protein
MDNPLAVAFVAVGALLGAYASGRLHQSVIDDASWAQVSAEADSAVKEANKTAKAQVDKLAADLKRLEAQRANDKSALQKALRAKVVCPASGEVGDVVVPADVVRRMWSPAAASQSAD